MPDKKYQVVCYMRVPTEDSEGVSLEEAFKEKDSLMLMQPENIYLVEEIDDPA